MAGKIEIHLQGTVKTALVSDRRWATLQDIQSIIVAHADSSVYTWVLIVVEPDFVGGTPRVLLGDLLNHYYTELPIAYSQERGVLYDLSSVPLREV